MRGRNVQRGGWDDEARHGGQTGHPDSLGYDDGYTGYYEDEQYAGGYDGNEGYDDEERGLVLQPEQSLVGVSNTITQHGVPLLSYSRTMSRFYNSRRQRLSLGRFKCEVCGSRIRFWAWQNENGTRTHDGCYERLAWTWTNIYAQQQRLAAEGRFE
jgi:hypothetical protein